MVQRLELFWMKETMVGSILRIIVFAGESAESGLGEVSMLLTA
jgi:hypothetical protein